MTPPAADLPAPDRERLRGEIARLETIEGYHREQSVWHHRAAEHTREEISRLIDQYHGTPRPTWRQQFRGLFRT